MRTYDTDGKIAQVDSGGLKSNGYDDAFRITGITDATNPANSWTYGYDLLDRLASATNCTVTQGSTLMTRRATCSASTTERAG